MIVSFIIPTLNEEKYLLKCLDAINNLELCKYKKEIIIIDAGSTDKTKEIANKMKCKIILNLKKTVGWARYLGLKNSTGNLIIFVDADCFLDINWFKENIKLLRDYSVGGIGGSTLIPNNETNFGKAVDFIFTKTGFYTKTVHVEKTSQMLVNDLPGSNCMYKRKILEKIMPIALDLLTADDVILNYKIRRLGYKLYINHLAKAYHYRRSNFRKLFNQMFRFAIGRVQVGRKNKELISNQHILIGLFLPIIILISLIFPLKIFLIYFGIFLFLAGLFSYIETGSVKIAFLAPLITLDILLAWSVGFLKESFVPTKI